MPEIVIIAAVARNRVIGRDNQLIWNIPEDMAHFKALTAGHTVIMGRKTWESLPPRFRPLPGRRNIAITRQLDYAAPGAEVADSLENALKLASTAAVVFVIGGEQIYTQAMAVADRLEITEVNLEPEGDAWFPEIAAVDWEKTTKTEGTSFAFVTYRRRTLQGMNSSPRHLCPSPAEIFAMTDLKNMTIAELLATHSNVLNELEERGVLRSKNNPTGDYGEWLVSKAMELTLAGNSAKGYDATDKQGLRYQIKCRRVTPSNPSTQLSVIRNLEEGNFDFLLAVIFDQDWEVMRAVKIAHSAIAKLATYRDHVNGHVMYVRPSIFSEAGIEDVSNLLSSNRPR